MLYCSNTHTGPVLYAARPKSELDGVQDGAEGIYPSKVNICWVLYFISLQYLINLELFHDVCKNLAYSIARKLMSTTVWRSRLRFALMHRKTKNRYLIFWRLNGTTTGGLQQQQEQKHYRAPNRTTTESTINEAPHRPSHKKQPTAKKSYRTN